LPNVSARYQAIVRGLRTIDRRVIGIEVECGDERDAIEADLVVDASGRGSRAAAWIEEITGDAVPTSEVSVGVSYTGVDVELLPSDLDRAVFTIVQNSPALARIGVALPAEGNRWKVVLGGYFGDAA